MMMQVAPRVRQTKKQWAIGLLIVCYSLSALSDAEKQTSFRTPTDRYTLVNTSALPEQQEPLNAFVHIIMGKEVLTVGQAIQEVLKGSGYRWVPMGDDKLLMGLSLPAIVRDMGPIRVGDAARTLAGNSWIMRTDSLNRVIQFEIDQRKQHKE
jgi:conjugative transfer region protein (TIGR03748 family)